MLAGMEWALTTAGIIATIVAILALAWHRGWGEGGSSVEMPGGETIFDAPRQPERPSPHRPFEG
jgi:hypothetical protein